MVTDRHAVRPSRSAAVVTGRLALVAIAAAAAAAGVAVRWRGVSPPAHEAHVLHVCPMHPEVTSASPGDCPICRMALVPMLDETSAPRTTASVHEAPDAFTLPPGLEVRGYDAFSKVKRFPLGLEMRAPAALETATTGVAALRLDEAELIEPGEEAHFAPWSGATLGKPFWTKVRVSTAPPVRRDRTTILVRFDLEPGTELQPGQTGTLQLKSKVRRGLVVKSSAILQSPEGPYVLVASEDRRTLTRRAVEMGAIVSGYATIVSGLREGEYALAQHAFVLDLERRLARRNTP